MLFIALNTPTLTYAGRTFAAHHVCVQSVTPCLCAVSHIMSVYSHTMSICSQSHDVCVCSQSHHVCVQSVTPCVCAVTGSLGLHTKYELIISRAPFSTGRQTPIHQQQAAETQTTGSRRSDGKSRVVVLAVYGLVFVCWRRNLHQSQVFQNMGSTSRWGHPNQGFSFTVTTTATTGSAALLVACPIMLLSLIHI